MHKHDVADDIFNSQPTTEMMAHAPVIMSLCLQKSVEVRNVKFLCMHARAANVYAGGMLFLLVCLPLYALVLLVFLSTFATTRTVRQVEVPSKPGTFACLCLDIISETYKAILITHIGSSQHEETELIESKHMPCLSPEKEQGKGGPISFEPPKPLTKNSLGTMDLIILVLDAPVSKGPSKLKFCFDSGATSSNLASLTVVSFPWSQSTIS